MVRQAYIDDSGDSEAFVLAGYLATSDQWAKFSDEWKILNDNRGGIPFKMSQINRRFGAESKEIVNQYLRVINRNLDVEISISFSMNDFNNVNDFYDRPKLDRNPYFLGFNAILTMALKALDYKKNADFIEFIFDEQTEKSRVINGWDAFMDTAPDRVKKIIPSSPIFRKDDDFLGLQAADLAAWWTRRRFKENKFMYSEDTLCPWEETRGIDAVRGKIDGRGMRKTLRNALYYQRAML